MLKYLVIALLVNYVISTNTNDFTLKYNCQITSNNTKISCRNLKTTELNLTLLDPSILELDLSNNQITKLISPSTPLKLISLNLSNNSIEVLDENYFGSFPSLKTLDLSLNPLKEIDKTAFDGLALLKSLNLSRTGYKLTNDLCSLTHLIRLDLEFLNLNELYLECWKETKLSELNIRNSINADVSAKNWLPFLEHLKILDISNSSISSLDSSHFKNLTLTHFISSNNPQLKLDFLNQTNLLNNLKCLVLRNNSLDSNNFALSELISKQSSNLKLEMLDVSFNLYTEDLNSFLYDQKNLLNLKYFDAHGNKFKNCNKRLDQVFTQNLEYIDLSNNLLEKSSCLYPLKQLNKLTYLDMSHNDLNINKNEDDLNGIFLNSLNLSYIDFSSNSFVNFIIKLSLNHTRIKLVDFSNNKLVSFRFESDSLKKEDSKDNDDDIMYDYDDEDGQDIIAQNYPSLDTDTDKRNITIDIINLSQNKFKSLNIYHQFQTIQNILYLNFSHNEIRNVNGLSGDIVLTKNIGEEKDEQIKMLCLDNADFSHNRILKVPNFQHSCISRVNLEHNQISSYQHLVVSNLTLYFLDLISLRFNNLERLGIVLSDQKFKSDFYTSKNSPFNYFYSHANRSLSNHTNLDLRENPMFKCDCNFFQLLHDYTNLNLFVDCKLNSEIIKNCSNSSNRTQELIVTKKPDTKTKQLNSKLRFFFTLTCFILVLFSMSLVFYMCSDFFKNFTYVDQIRGVLRRKYDQIKSERNKDNIDVQYSKLQDEATASTIEVNA
ncbi:unnamed protein product [Brachionus calyciflorus]|uniref:Uncharacterized protein n=1 Tax=Brachionus calyciflorus TaxID=104777 RepID=A0A814BZA5_9BILA|nr:unnamed protein product [Brachionus calyciflorus]